MSVPTEEEIGVALNETANLLYGVSYDDLPVDDIGIERRKDVIMETMKRLMPGFTIISDGNTIFAITNGEVFPLRIKEP